MQQDMNESKTAEKAEVSTQRRRFTVEEYHRMGEAGVFNETRVELIDGEIYFMSPINSPHAGTVKWLNRLLNKLLGDHFIISVQDPITLDNVSEPEPDIAVLKMRDDFYTDAHPQPEDILLLIEVADTSLDKDRNIKLPGYARAGIPEAWLVVLAEGTVEVHTQPSAEGYNSIQIFRAGKAIKSSMVEGLTVEEVFGARGGK